MPSTANLFKETRVLFAEDDPQVLENTGYMLRSYFKEVYLAKNGEEALELFDSREPDIVITDIRMPGKDGIALVHDIREYNSDVPIIMITAYSDEATLLQVVNCYLFDYIVKPVTHSKLLASLTRCLKTHPTFTKKEITLGEDLSYSFGKKMAFKAGKAVTLTHQEIDFLELLIAHLGEVVTYDTIEYQVWKEKPMSKDAIKTLVKKLRHKLESDMITTVIGCGYRLS